MKKNNKENQISPVDIIQKDDKVLRQTAKKVPLEQIGSSKIKDIIQNMIIALETQDDGVAIAAPQIGIPLQIFVVSKKVEMILKNLEEGKEEEKTKIKDSVYINPEIIKISRTKQILEEGCLSVRPLFGKVKRAEKATVEAYDETGKKFTRGGSGLLAQIFQHEIDHLNGILFVDKASNVIEVLPEKI